MLNLDSALTDGGERNSNGSSRNNKLQLCRKLLSGLIYQGVAETDLVAE
jgi:hypothetical protein